MTKYIPLEEVEKMILNANIGGLARASLFAEKTNLSTIDPIATIDAMEKYNFGGDGYIYINAEELKSRLSLHHSSND